MWARLMRERFGAQDERSLMLRFHTQTGGSTLTSQQPLNNVVRVTLQALAAVLGGTQSLHTNGYDEALSLPTAEAATLALRTQQIIGYESGVTAVADPLGGSYFVEALTDEIEAKAMGLIQHIDDLGGAVRAIEDGFMQAQIMDVAYEFQQRVESGEQIVVGVNTFVTEEAPVPIFKPSAAVGEQQAAALVRIRGSRDNAAVQAALGDVRRAAEGSANVLHPMRAALKELASIGEVCGVLRQVWGEYRPDVRI
jgi:methylmalonyl-CoA mutase N-terminal domain/subunit